MACAQARCVQVARDLGTLWATLQPPTDCTPPQRETLLLDVATASAAAHSAWQSEQDLLSKVQWSSKVCIQNQSLLGTTVRVRRQLNLTGGTVR